MQTQFVHTKLRKTFGRECLFSARHEILCSIPPDREFFKENYVLKNPTDKGTELAQEFASSVALTDRTEYSHRGMLHSEGGWPKEVNYQDEEQPGRYKKKIEKDDSYIKQVGGLMNPLDHTIQQNNAVNIYQTYFEDMKTIEPPVESIMQQIQTFRDPCQFKRPVRHISWSADSGAKISTAHTNMDMSIDALTDSYVWDVG